MTGTSPLSGFRTFCSLALMALMALLWAGGGAACRRVPDFEAYREQASSLTTEHAAELAQLGKRLDGLRRRAAALAEDAPGAAEARALVARCEAEAGGLGAAVSGLAGKVASAIKTAEPASVERTLAVAASQIERGVTALRSELDAAASELARAEEKAPAAKAPAPR